MDDELARVASAFPPPVRSRVIELFSSLDDDQVVAVLQLQSRQPGLVGVRALAGSGKTRVALGMIAYWVGLVLLGETRGNIVAPTFTVAATIELAGRVRGLLGGTKGVVICTWEHLYRLLLRELGLWDREMWSREEEVRWLIGKVGDDILDQFPDKVDHAGLFHMLHRAVDLIARDQPIDSNLDLILKPAWEEMTAEAAREQALLEDGVRRLAAHHVGMLVTHVLESPAWGVGVVVCDEDQDQSVGDLVLPVALARHVPVVSLGDTNQEVMGFRGGVGAVYPYYEAAGIALRRCALPTNYRATCALNHSAAALMRANGVGEPYPKAAPHAAEGTPALFVECASETEIAEICAWIHKVVFGTSDADPQAGLHVPEMRPEVEGALARRLDPLAGQIKSEELIYLAPTNRIGHWLEGALEARGVKVRFVGAGQNPYEGLLASLAATWLETPGEHMALSQLVPALDTILRGYLSFGRSNTRARREMVSEILERLRRDHRREPDKVVRLGDYIVDLVSKAVNGVGDSMSTSYELIGLFSEWSQPYESRSERLRELSLRLPKCAEREVSRDPNLANQVLDSWPASFRLLVADDVMSMEPAELLCNKARAWQLAKRNRRSAGGPEICTYHGAKGLTRMLVVVIRSDVLGRDLADPFPGVAPSEDGRRSEAYRLAYVALTRASEVYVELSLGPANLLHHGGLDGWEYI